MFDKDYIAEGKVRLPEGHCGTDQIDTVRMFRRTVIPCSFPRWKILDWIERHGWRESPEAWAAQGYGISTRWGRTRLYIRTKPEATP